MFRAILLFVSTTLFLVSATSALPARQEADPVYDGKKGSVWVNSLVNDTSARRRALAVEALAKLWSEKRYQESLPSISRALRLDSSVAVRTQAAVALSTLKESDIKYVGKDLVDALEKEKESRVRKEIAVIMGRHPVVAKLGVGPLTAALKDPDPATRIAVAEALAQAGADAKSAAANLAPMLTDEDRAVRRAAVIALGRITPEGAPAIAESLCKMLQAEKELDMRTEILTSIGLLGERSPSVVATLAGLLADPDESLRRRATRILGTFGLAAAPAAEAILKVAQSDKMKDIQVDAVRAFGSALGPDLKKRLKDLLTVLADPDYEVRVAVVEELGALGHEIAQDAESIKALRLLRRDPHLKVREAATQAIQKIEKKPEPKKDPEIKKDKNPVQHPI